MKWDLGHIPTQDGELGDSKAPCAPHRSIVPSLEGDMQYLNCEVRRWRFDMIAKSAVKKASRHILALALFCLLVAGLANASLEMNAYGEVVNVSETISTNIAPIEDTTKDKAIAEASSDVTPMPGEVGAEITQDHTGEMEDGKTPLLEVRLTDSNSAKSMNDSSGDEEEDVAEKRIVNAIVYVFNRDDDKLAVTLFIDSDLKDTDDISKDKEEKFGTYPLDVGPHKFKIAWWDDDTKKGHENVTVVNLEEDEAITLYTIQNKEPEEYDVNVQVRNDNDVNLDAYLYIDGEYEKQKEIKKTSTTDLGKFDLEEGTHELAIRWQDPDTKVEYEKRKTIHVDGKDAVIFYAPKGISFETEDADEIPKTTRYTSSTGSTSSTMSTGSRTTSSKVASTSSKTSSSTSKDERDDSNDDSSKEYTSASKADLKEELGGESDSTKESNKKSVSTSSSPAENARSSVQTIAEKSSKETSDGNSPIETKDNNPDEVAPPIDGQFYVMIAGLILAIYLIFFRR